MSRNISIMKIYLIPVLVLFLGLSCFGQEVEFCGSLNNSTEQRLQNSYGIGLQYQHDIGTKFKFGAGVHYISNNAHFVEIPYLDGDPNLLTGDEINSTSHRFSIRLNVQYLLKTNDHVSLSLGPELSCNYFWGTDEIDERTSQNLTRNQYSVKNDLVKAIGIGFISKIEVKDFIDPHLSLCFTIRPEITTNGIFAKGGSPVFSGVLGFTEFQIGLKYRFKK
jgi:hypothetical protein